MLSIILRRCKMNNSYAASVRLCKKVNVMKILVQVTITLSIFALCAENASACSCVAAASPDKAFRSAPSVFIGMVTKITPAKRAGAVMPLSGKKAGQWEQMEEGVWVVTLNVQESFKGVRGSAVELVTDTDTAACGYPFEVGQSYLVYAYQRASARQRYGGEGLSRSLLRAVDNFNRGLNPLETNLCTRTNNVKESEEEVGLIRRLSQRRKPYSRRRIRNTE